MPDVQQDRSPGHGPWLDATLDALATGDVGLRLESNATHGLWQLGAAAWVLTCSDNILQAWAPKSNERDEHDEPL